jgi:hypothetical protein
LHIQILIFMFEAIEYAADKERLQQIQQDVQFPIYKTNDRGELFMVCSFKKIISLRWDDLVKAIGVSDNIGPQHFISVFKFQSCRKEEFAILRDKLLTIINEEG